MLHENDQNRADEERIIKAFSDEVEKDYQICSHGAYPVDALLLKNKRAVAFAEARKVGYSRSKYPWFIWSFQKYVHILNFSDLLPVFLLVEYPEGIYVHRISREHCFPVVWVDRGETTGRTSADNEPCVRIMNETFSPLYTEGSNDEKDGHTQGTG